MEPPLDADEARSSTYGVMHAELNTVVDERSVIVDVVVKVEVKVGDVIDGEVVRVEVEVLEVVVVTVDVIVVVAVKVVVNGTEPIVQDSEMRLLDIGDPV